MRHILNLETSVGFEHATFNHKITLLVTKSPSSKQNDTYHIFNYDYFLNVGPHPTYIFHFIYIFDEATTCNTNKFTNFVSSDELKGKRTNSEP